MADDQKSYGDLMQEAADAGWEAQGISNFLVYEPTRPTYVIIRTPEGVQIWTQVPDTYVYERMRREP